VITYCTKCGEPLSREIPFGDRTISVPLVCKCKREEREEFERQDKINREMLRNADIIRNGYLDRYYAELTWDKDDSPDSKASKDLRRYVAKWERMKEENIGLLLIGSYGTGKTFYASCIANDIRRQGEFVLIGTLSKLIAEMNADYGRNRTEWEEKIMSYPLMVIDDFGIERETDYNFEQIENIIDLRYRSHRPTIVTTNLSPDEIKNIRGDIRKERAWSRIREMCTPYVITGKDRRKDTGNAKIERLKELFSE